MIEIEEWMRWYDVVFIGDYQIRLKISQGVKNLPDTSLEEPGSIRIKKLYKDIPKK